MSNREINSVEDLFMKYGGVAQIGITIQESPWNIIKWKIRGVPVRYWDKLEEAYGLAPGILHSISKKAKNGTKRD